MRRRLHRRHCRPPGDVGPASEVFGPERMVARDARSLQPRFQWGVGSAPHAPERWLRSLLVGPYQCEHASHVACNRVGRRHTAGRFGRQAVWRSRGSSRPPPADTSCLAKRRCYLQKRVFCAEKVAEVRLLGPVHCVAIGRSCLSVLSSAPATRPFAGLHQVVRYCARWPKPAVVPGAIAATGSSRQRC